MPVRSRHWWSTSTVPLQRHVVTSALLLISACSGGTPTSAVTTPPPATQPNPVPFQPVETRVGALDETGYFSLEISPDMKYLLWQETTGGVPGPIWTCGIDPQSAALIPADCRGFRGPTVLLPSAPQWGIDADGVFYVTIDATGAFVIGRPTSNTTGTLTRVAGLTNTSRQYPYPTRVATRAKPLIAYLQNDSQGRPQLFYMDLATPTVETALTTGPVDMSYGTPSFLFTIYRWFSGLPILAYGANDAIGRLQIKEVDFSQGAPTSRFVTNDAYDHVDYFPALRSGQRTMVGGVDTRAIGAFAVRNESNGQYVEARRVDVSTVSALAQPTMAASFELFEWDGKAYASFLVLDGGRKPGSFPAEIWVTSLDDGSLRRRISAPETLFRMDPEYFVGPRGVSVFYYAKRGSKPGFELYRATTGLGTN
jgi:hypothetical protein